MNKLDQGKRVQIIASLVEGNSLRATARMCDVAFNTVLKLLPEIGQACEDYQRRVLVSLPCKRIQCDEIWSFCYAKEKNVPDELCGKGYGDVWTWVAIDADTKLVPCWRIGDRKAWDAQHFMYDLAARLANRVQLTTDGHRVYLQAVEGAFGNDIDYAMLVKIYGSDRAKGETRYSPPDYMGCRSMQLVGNPNPKHISTSFAERQNLTMRMKMRRMTADERVLKEAGQSPSRNRASLHALQLLPRAPDVARYPGDGSRHRRPRLEHRRSGRIVGYG
jgi:hypothetical protein